MRTLSRLESLVDGDYTKAETGGSYGLCQGRNLEAEDFVKVEASCS